MQQIESPYKDQFFSQTIDELQTPFKQTWPVYGEFNRYGTGQNSWWGEQRISGYGNAL